MAIEFQCPHCQGTLKLKDKFAGQRGSCKHCGGEILVPSAAAADDLDLSFLDDAPPPVPAARPVIRPASTLNGRSTDGLSSNDAPKNGALANGHSNGPPRSRAPAAAAPAEADADLVRFYCDQCGRRVKVTPSAAGRLVACPRCAQQLRVPGAPAARPPSAPAPRTAGRPLAAAPQMDGLELLPEPDGLELLPETNGLMDALDDTIALAPAAAPLKPLPAPRPMASPAKRRKNEQSFWQSPAMQAGGGALTTLLVMAGIAFKVYRRVVVPVMNDAAAKTPVAQNDLSLPPYVNPGPPAPATVNNGAAPAAAPMPAVNSTPAGGSTPETAAMIAEAQSVLSTLERNLQLARQMTDAASAQRLAGDWALQYVDAIDAGERLGRFTGRVVSSGDKQAYESIGRNCENQLKQLDSHIVHLAGLPDVRPILADALDQAIAARPTSAVARELQKQGQSSSGMAGLSRWRAEMHAEHEARREEAKIRMEQMKAESDARMAQMKADSDRRMAEMQERMRAQSDSMRNRSQPGRPGMRP
jgi:hypothetical protein